ncbi:MAG: MFS transporter [Elusimicrobia bacterium]|nr:MFS transporter [Candidatus Obscuribacterium magneticum]MCB4757338.1 MFS transporter [Candidatus Obscuribacterium magneticum]
METPELNGFQHIFRSLRSRNFGLFFTGQGISLIGTWMQQIAMSWLVFRLTNSAFLLGVVGFCNQIPTFLLASFGGVLADRWNRYRILIVTQILSMIQAFVLAILTLRGTIAVWHVVVLGLFLGTVNALDIPTRQAFMVDMVEEKEDLGNAIALNSALVNAARLLGPSLAGILIALVGEGTCFLINAVSFLAVIAALLAMKIVSPKTAPSKTDMWRGWKEGILYAYGFMPIGAILALLSLVSLMGMSYAVLMPIIVTGVFHGGPRTLGFLMGASGLGALVGTFYLASRKNVVGLCRIMPLASGLLGMGLIAFAFSRLFWFSFVMIAVTGFGMIVEMAASNTVLQTIVDDDKRGRVMSLYAMAFMGMAPFGSLLAGAIANKMGAPVTLVFCGISCLLGALIFARKLPAIRQVVRPIYRRLGILPGGSPEI